MQEIIENNLDAFGLGQKIQLDFKRRRDAALNHKHDAQNQEMVTVCRGIVNIKIVGDYLSKYEAEEDQIIMEIPQKAFGEIH